MKSIVYAFLLIWLIVSLQSCLKSGADDLSGTIEQSGTVRYVDTLRGAGESRPLPNQTIKIGYTDKVDAGEFLYSVKSTVNSEFNFTNLSSTEYTVMSETSVNGLDFRGEQSFQPGSPPLQLTLFPDTIKTNLILITTRDKVSNGRLNNVKVCVFSSRFLAGSNNCDGSFISGQSDSYGKFLLKGLSPGKYYINTELITGSVNIRVKDSVDVSRSTGLYSKEVYLE